MKLIKLFALPLLLTSFLLASCNNENIDSTDTPDPDPQTEEVTINPLVGRSVSATGGLELDCITVLYPFELVDDIGNNYTVVDENSFTTLFLDSDAVIVDFIYPLDIEDGDGATISISDNTELADAFSSCLPTGGWDEESFPAYDISDDNSCYELVYPLSLVAVDGSTIVVNDAAEFDAAVASQLYFFTFPLSLLDEDGMTVTVADVDGLFDALFSCGGWNSDSLDIGWEDDFEYIGCYMVEFPMSIVLVDGTTVTVNNHMELCDYMLRGEMVDYGYPLTLTDVDGTTVVVNNQEELYAALEDCEYQFADCAGLTDLLWFGTQPLSSDSTACYVLDYPVSFSDDQGTTATLGDQVSFDSAVTNGQILGFCPDYPLTLTYQDGTTATINNEVELFSAFTVCE